MSANGEVNQKDLDESIGNGLLFLLNLCGTLKPLGAAMENCLFNAPLPEASEKRLAQRKPDNHYSPRHHLFYLSRDTDVKAPALIRGS